MRPFWVILSTAVSAGPTLAQSPPANTLAVVTIVLTAISLSSVLFVILDLSAPYGGFFSIPSTTMRAALSSMLSNR